MNIVIPFRNTCGDEELQMCIKLIMNKLNKKWEKIYVIGDKVHILNGFVENVVIEEQKYNKWLDSNFLISQYIERIGKPFILFNDDFFLTKEVDNIPNYYCSYLSSRIETTWIINEKTNELKLSSYGLNIKSFIKNFGDYKNFEVHIPIEILYPSIMQKAIELCNTNDCPALKRSMYMLICEENGYESAFKERNYDVKFNEPLRVMQYPFFSLTDNYEFKAFREKLEEIAAA